MKLFDYLNRLITITPYTFRSIIKKYLLGQSLFYYLYNLYIKKVEIKKFKKEFKPKVVYIEITNCCNADCIMCVRKEMTRKIGFMDLELYKKIIDECAVWNVNEIRLHNIGEPLLDKFLVERIVYAKKKKIPKIVFYTNGSLLNPSLSKEIILAGIDEIFISLDATNKHTFEKIRKGLKYEQVLDGIQSLLAIKSRRNLVSPKIFLAYTCMDLNRKEINSFKLKWQNLVDNIYFCDICDWGGQKIIHSNIYHFKRKWPCVYLWKTMFILWNGDAVPCCLDFDGKIKLGNAKEESIPKIWINDKYQNIRRSHLNHLLDSIPLCKHCTSNRLWSQYD